MLYQESLTAKLRSEALLKRETRNDFFTAPSFIKNFLIIYTYNKFRTYCPIYRHLYFLHCIIYTVNKNMKLRIKDMREDNDLTQKKISEMLMCDQSLYSKYERGEREIPLNLIIKLADYYNVSLDYLTGRCDEPGINKKYNK